MSRFYLVEFRYKRQRRWHPWVRTDGRAEARRQAMSLLRPRFYLRLDAPSAAAASRVVAIDTDAGTLTTIWEGP